MDYARTTIIFLLKFHGKLLRFLPTDIRSPIIDNNNEIKLPRENGGGIENLIIQRENPIDLAIELQTTINSTIIIQIGLDTYVK